MTRSSKTSNKVGPEDETKSKWTTAISGVKKRQLIRRTSVPEPDPFLDRFTVTGRDSSDQAAWTCAEIFTKEHWRTLVIDPASLTYYYWSLVVTLAILYNLIFIIMRAVFYQIQEGGVIQYWLMMDYICDFLYIIDMMAKSRISFLEQGLLVQDVKRVIHVYLKSNYFIVDIISILPFELFYFVVGINTLFRLNRLFKIWRFMEFFHLAETHTSFPNFFRVGNLILYIVILIHWNACFYFTMSRYLGFGLDGWTYPDIEDPKFSSFFKQYLWSFYWSTLTLTTIGDTAPPEHEFAYIFCIVDCLMGVLIFATVFGNVGAMINHMNATRTEFQHKVDAVKRYMEIRKIQGELETRVIKWFDYTWNNKQSTDDRDALTFLPEKLRAELGIHVHMKTLRQVAIFQDCEPGLLVELVLKLRLQVFSPGDYICRKGDIGKEMYIVKRGRLQVVSEDGKQVWVTLSDGSVFGEVSILNIAGNKTGNRRTASVKSVGYSDLFILSKNDLWEALKEYPDAQSLLMSRGKQILRKDKLIDEEAAKREEKRQQALVTKVEMILETVDYIHKDVCQLTGKSTGDSVTDLGENAESSVATNESKTKADNKPDQKESSGQLKKPISDSPSQDPEKKSSVTSQKVSKSPENKTTTAVSAKSETENKTKLADTAKSPEKVSSQKPPTKPQDKDTHKS